jgi:succinate dehydrogenase / fumarate reductase iron-sulfur subunit
MERTFKIFRFNPEKDKKGHYQTFTIEVQPAWTVLDALNYIKWFKDGTLTYRRSCRHGICGSCGMKINGINALACELQISAIKRKTIVVDPLNALPVLKDLVVDWKPLYKLIRDIKPYLINDEPPPDKERLQSPEDYHKIMEATFCILCALCTTSCPSFWANRDSLGPSALLKAYRYIFDTRDQGTENRMEMINNKQGLWRCHTIFNCVDVCPKKINITEAISKLKTKVMLEKY